MAERLQLRFSFFVGLRGYHEYRLIWTPALNEVLKAKQEPSNCHDMYAIACTKKLPSRLTVSTVDTCLKKCRDSLSISFSMERELFFEMTVEIQATRTLTRIMT